MLRYGTYVIRQLQMPIFRMYVVMYKSIWFCNVIRVGPCEKNSFCKRDFNINKNCRAKKVFSTGYSHVVLFALCTLFSLCEYVSYYSFPLCCISCLNKCILNHNSQSYAPVIWFQVSTYNFPLKLTLDSSFWFPC